MAEPYNQSSDYIDVCADDFVLSPNVSQQFQLQVMEHCSLENYIQQQFKTYALPLLIVFGSIGNVFVFIVLMRKNVRQWSICFYMAIFAITNTVLLYVGCGLDWVSHITGFPHIAIYADWICRVWQFAFSVIMYSSYWLVVAMCIDRFLILWMPEKGKELCTVFMSKVVTIIIHVGLIVISIHAMWTYELTEYGCNIAYGSQDFHSKAWPWISAALYSYVPFLIIFILVILLMIGLLMPSMRHDLSPIQLRFTNVTLLTAGMFLLLTMPTLVLNLMQYSNPEWMRDPALYFMTLLLHELCNTLSCLNLTFTFILYFATVPLLRKEFKLFICQLGRFRYRRAVTELHTIEANGDMMKYSASPEEPAMATLL